VDWIDRVEWARLPALTVEASKAIELFDRERFPADGAPKRPATDNVILGNDLVQLSTGERSGLSLGIDLRPFPIFPIRRCNPCAGTEASGPCRADLDGLGGIVSRNHSRPLYGCPERQLNGHY
jgi:hypothetical protein